jgi:hypothetical protein
MRVTQNKHIVLVLSNKFVQDLIDFLCLVDDDGTVSDGWKSPQLLECIDTLEKSLNEGYVTHTK